jgi:DNA-binding NtrC family response regulator
MVTMTKTRRDRILVVDDEQDARELFAAVLDQAGYAAEVARDGFEALKKLESARPDLVVSDVQMPGMLGPDLIQHVRKACGEVPVILITGTETHDLCTSAEQYGAVACLEKPVNLDDLVWTIESALACQRDRYATAANGR